MVLQGWLDPRLVLIHRKNPRAGYDSERANGNEQGIRRVSLVTLTCGHVVRCLVRCGSIRITLFLLILDLRSSRPNYSMLMFEVEKSLS